MTTGGCEDRAAQISARAARPPRRLARRRLFRALLGSALLLAGLLTPAGPDSFSGDDNAAESGVAHAQTPDSIVDGTPSDCAPVTHPLSTEWVAADDICILNIPACPLSPADAGSFLTESTTHPGFCEQHLSGNIGYLSCTRTRTEQRQDGIDSFGNPIMIDVQVPALKGAIKEYDDGNPSAGCMLYNLPTCEYGRRVSESRCELIERRTWTCPTDYTPMNKFNKCYKAPDDYTGAHPACQGGSPSFPIEGYCETYVDQDFVRSPGSDDCRSYETSISGDTMSANSKTGVSAKYWCEYNSSLFDMVCHTSSFCASETGWCIMRASTTGGCDRASETIICREHQANFARGWTTVEAVRSQQCPPCVILPFSPVPFHCPDDIRSDPSQFDRLLNYTFEFGTDIGFDETRRVAGADKSCRQELDEGVDISTSAMSHCTQGARCDVPSLGATLDWQSQHASGLPIVNSAIVSSIESGIPIQTETVFNARIADFSETTSDVVFPAGTIFPRGQQFTDDFTLTDDTIANLEGEVLSRGVVLSRDIILREDLELKKGYHLQDTFNIAIVTSNPYLFPQATRALDPLEPNSVYRILQTFDPDDARNPYDTTPNDLTDDWIGVGSSLNRDTRAWAADCFPVELPAFQLRIRELWPDNAEDRASILQLFGDDSLSWWNSLTDTEKERRTEGRGLKWWDDLTSDQRESRVASLTEVITCSAAPQPWCRWIPRGRGYFEVSMESAWVIEKFDRRAWEIPSRMVLLDRQLSDANTDIVERTVVRQSVRETYERIARTISGLNFTDEQLTQIARFAGDIRTWLNANVPTKDPAYDPAYNVPSLVYSRYSNFTDSLTDDFAWDTHEARNFILGRESSGGWISGRFSTQGDLIKFQLNATGLSAPFTLSYTNLDEARYSYLDGIDGDGQWDRGFITGVGEYDETLIWLEQQVAEWMAVELADDGTPTGIMDYPTGVVDGRSDADIEFIYQQQDPRFTCPTLDVRIRCGNKQLFGIFVPEGESVGISVNELRVSSRTPTE